MNQVELTPKEFDVLATLARSAGAAASRERLMDEVWGDAYLTILRSLDVHVAGLHGKIARPRIFAVPLVVDASDAEQPERDILLHAIPTPLSGPLYSFQGKGVGASRFRRL